MRKPLVVVCAAASALLLAGGVAATSAGAEEAPDVPGFAGLMPDWVGLPFGGGTGDGRDVTGADDAGSAGAGDPDGGADPAGLLGGWLRPGESAVVLSAGGEVRLGDGGHAGHAAAGARAHRDRRSGRLVRFPGSEALPAVLPLAELTERCAVEAVDLLGVADAPGLVLRTRGHVRPLFRDGVLVLPVTAWDDGEVRPFERPAPRAWCADH